MSLHISRCASVAYPVFIIIISHQIVCNFKQIHPGQSDEEKFLSSTRVLAQQVFRITKEFPFPAVSEAPLQMHKTDVIYIYSYSASLWVMTTSKHQRPAALIQGREQHISMKGKPTAMLLPEWPTASLFVPGWTSWQCPSRRIQMTRTPTPAGMTRPRGRAKDTWDEKHPAAAPTTERVQPQRLRKARGMWYLNWNLFNMTFMW